MRPQRARSMSFSARLVQWKAPLRFVSTTPAQSSSGIRMARPSAVTPALLTSTRTGPKRSWTSSNAACTEAGSATSAWTSAPLPALRPSVATVQPSLRSRSAMAAPIPRVPPVTSATPSRPSGADRAALLPAHDARAPDEAGAEGGQRDGRARAQPPVGLGLGQRERDRRRRRVGDAVDVEDELLGRQPQLGGGRLEDARVGLVGDQQVEVGDGEAGVVEGV